METRSRCFSYSRYPPPNINISSWYSITSQLESPINIPTMPCQTRGLITLVVSRSYHQQIQHNLLWGSLSAWTQNLISGWIGVVKTGLHQSIQSVPPNQCSLIIIPQCPRPRIIRSNNTDDRGRMTEVECNNIKS